MLDIYKNLAQSFIYNVKWKNAHFLLRFFPSFSLPFASELRLCKKIILNSAESSNDSVSTGIKQNFSLSCPFSAPFSLWTLFPTHILGNMLYEKELTNQSQPMVIQYNRS